MSSSPLQQFAHTVCSQSVLRFWPIRLSVMSGMVPSVAVIADNAIVLKLGLSAVPMGSGSPHPSWVAAFISEMPRAPLTRLLRGGDMVTS